MGMYTYISFKVEILPEYHSVIDHLVNSDGAWSDTEFVEYANWNRSGFIPFGAVCNHVNTFSEGIWTVNCSLKNYEGTLEAFVRIVANNIFKSIEYFNVETDFDDECNIINKTFEFVDGIIVGTTHYRNENEFNYYYYY